MDLITDVGVIDCGLNGGVVCTFVNVVDWTSGGCCIPRHHKRMIILIGIYRIWIIPNPIIVGVNVGVIIPVVAEVVCVSAAVVGVGY